MSELRILPHLRKAPLKLGGIKDKRGGTRHKHSVWDSRPATKSAAGRGGSASWFAAYAMKLRVSDALVTLAVVSIAYLASLGAAWRDGATMASESGYLWVCIAVVLLWNLDLEYCRTREKRVFGAGVGEYRRAAHATMRTIGITAIAMLVFQIDMSRGFFAVALPLGLAMLVGERWLWRRQLVRQRTDGKALSNVVVLGNPQDVAYVIGHLRSNLATGYRVVGAALTTLQPNMLLLPPWYEVPVLSSMDDIAEVVSRTGAEAVVVAGTLPGGPEAIQELGWRLEDMSTELVLASSLTNVAGPRVHFRPVEGLPLMHVELPQYSGGKHIVKRLMDVVLASLALLVLAPLFLVLAVIVKLDSPGPVLFRQERIGKNGLGFRMVKFRSMVVGAEAKRGDLLDDNEGSGLLFKMAHDPRVTRCGTWMRKFSLDELPQFWNVLRGQMSLVGPRPPLEAEVAKYRKPVQRRLLIKPGITGLWQIGGRSDLPWEEAVRLDLYYVENWSLTGDLVILWRTFKAVAAPVGAY